MEDSFQVIENYLMVRMPEEIDHHKSVYISKKADDFTQKIICFLIILIRKYSKSNYG